MNNKKLLVSIGLITVASFIVILARTSVVSAQSSNGNGQGLEIAPPLITLKADPGKTVTAQIQIRDVTNSDLVVTGAINDFVAAGEDGTPKLILDENEKNPYSIKDWISPLPELTLKPRQILPITVIINVPANAAPGGYYGVVRFTGTPPELKDTGVSLSASLGTLLLLTVNGTPKENLSIEEFSVNKNGGTGTVFESAPLQFVERLKNSGNIHEQPTGLATITDMFGNKVAVVNVYQPPTNILPGSTRKYDQMLDSKTIGNKILFGRYTAELKLTYGTDKKVITQTISFWVIPYTLIGIAIALLIAAFMALRYAIKRYNRHIRNQVLGIQKPKKIKTPKK